MKKIVSLITAICLLNALAIAGLVGFLALTGRIDKAKLLTISDMLKQSGSPEGMREKVYDVMVPAAPAATQTQPAATQKAAGGGGVPGTDAPATAQERIDYLQKLLEEERLRLDNQKQELLNRQELLANKQRLLESAQLGFEQEKKAFEAKVAALSNTKDTAGFQKTMALFDELKPKQVKDLLTAMTPEEITRFLSAMEPDRAAKIIAEFKTPDEKTAITNVLDRMRGAVKPNGTGAAIGNPADASTASATPAKAAPALP